MSRIGAEMGQMDQLAQVFTQKSAQIDELTAAIDGQVGGTWWEGPAADRFREQWSGSFKPNLQQLQQALNECSSEVRSRRAAIEAAGS